MKNRKYKSLIKKKLTIKEENSKHGVIFKGDVIEFKSSLKAVRNKYLNLERFDMKSAVEKILYVNTEELKKTLNNVQKKGFSSENNIIELSENEINTAYKKILVNGIQQ